MRIISFFFALLFFCASAWGQSVFKLLPTNGLMAFSFAETKDSATWFAMGNGYGTGSVGFVSKNGTKIFTEDDGLPSASYEQIFVSSDGVIWAGGFMSSHPNEAVVARYVSNHWKIMFLTSTLEPPIVKKFAEAFNGEVWIATYSGIYFPKDTIWGLFTTVEGLPDNKVNDVLTDSHGRTWIGTESGVCLFDKGDFITFEDAAVISSVSILKQDSRGYVWAGGKFCNDGVSVFDGIRWRTYTMEDGLTENTVGAITEDYFGRMWFGGYYDSKSGGITMLNNGKFSEFRYPEIAKYSVDCIFSDRFGGVWAGGSLTERSKFGLSYYRKGSWKKLGTAYGITNDRILNIYIDKSDRVWISTFGGLFYSNLSETIKHFDAKL